VCFAAPPKLRTIGIQAIQIVYLQFFCGNLSAIPVVDHGFGGTPDRLFSTDGRAREGIPWHGPKFFFFFIHEYGVPNRLNRVLEVQTLPRYVEWLVAV
jgi:hypothetical protein